MRLRMTLFVAWLAAGAFVPAQEIQGPEPGVFLYDYDTTTEQYTRTYHSSQQEARQVLEPLWNQGRIVAAQLNQQVQSNVNEEAVAKWLVFFDQWHKWQGWVIQEYDLEDLGESTFAAVPGTPLQWLQEEPEEEAEGPPQRGLSEREIGAASGFAGGFEGELGGIPADVGVAPTAAGGEGGVEEGPTASVTIATFLPQSEPDQEATIETIQTAVEQLVADAAEEQYEVLARILDRIDENADQRQRRGAYLALRQREINELAEIILNRRNATEIDVGGKLYLFSDRPLSRIPEGAVNVDTPNLTPFDIFEADGSVRAVPE